MSKQVNSLVLDLILVGRVVPSRRMQFAATCTLSPSGGVIPEADPIYLKTLLEKLDMEKERSGTITFKPPLPARYRHEVYLKLLRIMHSDEFPFLSVIPQYGELFLVLMLIHSRWEKNSNQRIKIKQS